MFKRFFAVLVSLLVLSSGVYASGSATSDTVQTKKHTVKEKAHKAPQKKRQKYSQCILKSCN
ncbi:MAG: hypothetical protein LRY52_05665 [Sulfurospirillum cavolei]|nr:hypothetical protein [Sulfurospirillum cavolei]